MLLLLHIIVALASVGYTTYLFFTAPQPAKLQFAYGLVGLTVSSGTVLIVTSPTHLVQACISGITYISAVSVALVVLRRKWAKATSTE